MKGGRVHKPFSMPPEDWSPGDPEPRGAPASIHAGRLDAPPLPQMQREMRQREAFLAQLPEGQQFMEQQPAHLRNTLYNSLGPTWGAVPEGVEGGPGVLDWVPGIAGGTGTDDALYALGSGDKGRIAEEGTIAAANLFLPHIAGAVIKKAAPAAKAVFEGGRNVLADLMNPKFGGSNGRR